MELTLVVHKEAPGYWSEVRELPGCFASARTLDELRLAVGEAVGMYLWDRPAVLAFPERTLRVGDVSIQALQPSAD